MTTTPEHSAAGSHPGDAAAGLPTAIEVSAVEDVSASMRRIRFTGEGVAAYLSAPRIPNIKVFFPVPGKDLDLPTPGGRHHYAFADGQRERVRTYTVRAFNVDQSWLDIDFVRHGQDGLASAWAETARPGDRIGALGGGGRLPAHRPWMLFVADDTALPALAAILEGCRPDQRGLALIEVSGPEDEQNLRAPEGFEIRWLHRGSTHPGASRLLMDEALDAVLPTERDDIFVWASAESHVVRAVRRHVRAAGIPRVNQLIIGYWHWGQTEPSYSAADNHDRVRDESAVMLPEHSTLDDHALPRLLARGPR